MTMTAYKTPESGQWVTVEAPCRLHKEHPTLVFQVKEADLATWNGNDPKRPHIQEVFPYLNPDQREMFITGMCPVCWKRMEDAQTDAEQAEMERLDEDDRYL